MTQEQFDKKTKGLIEKLDSLIKEGLANKLEVQIDFPTWSGRTPSLHGNYNEGETEYEDKLAWYNSSGCSDWHW